MANEDKKDDLGQAGQSPGPGVTPNVDPGTSPGASPGAGGQGDAAGEVPAGVGPFEQARRDRAGASATGSTGSSGSGRERSRGAGASTKAAPPPASAPRRSGRGGGFIAGILGSLLVLGLTAVAGYVTRDRWAPPVAGLLAQHLPKAPAQAENGVRVAEAVNTLKSETSDVRSQLAASTNRLSSLQQELESLKQEVDRATAARAAAANEPQAAMPAPQPEQPDISQPLEDIDQRLSQLEIGSDRLDAVEQQLGTIQSSLSEVRTAVTQTGEEAKRPAATVLAVNQLAEALGRSGGYAQQLETVRVIAGDDAALAEALGTLQQWAGSGVTTFGELRARFPEMARAVAQTDYRREGDSWLDSVTNRLTSLVTVRKVGDAALAAGGTDAALTQAETALQNGDLSGAVKALESLDGPAAEAASGWLKQAQDRLAAEQALADLRMAAIAQLNAARG